MPSLCVHSWGLNFCQVLLILSAQYVFPSTPEQGRRTVEYRYGIRHAASLKKQKFLSWGNLARKNEGVGILLPSTPEQTWEQWRGVNHRQLNPCPPGRTEVKRWRGSSFYQGIFDALVFSGCSLVWFHFIFLVNIPLLLKSVIPVSAEQRKECVSA